MTSDRPSWWTFLTTPRYSIAAGLIYVLVVLPIIHALLNEWLVD